MKQKTININLFDTQSIRKAVEELRRYKDDLHIKCDKFVERLAEVGVPIINENIAIAKGTSDKEHNIYIKVHSFDTYSEAVLVVEGKDILFIEFGAGVYYNSPAGTSPHPLGKEKGYTIGSYGQGKGKQNTWFYYEESGELVMTHGTQATMPVYKAALEIKKDMLRIASEVFA